ncbi:hypothetical protein GQX74_002349, partial [Glossina fuscipes]
CQKKLENISKDAIEMKMRYSPNSKTINAVLPIKSLKKAKMIKAYYSVLNKKHNKLKKAHGQQSPLEQQCRIRKHVNVCNEKDRIGENKKQNSEVARLRKLANKSLPSTDRKNEANQLNTMIRIQ